MTTEPTAAPAADPASAPELAAFFVDGRLTLPAGPDGQPELDGFLAAYAKYTLDLAHDELATWVAERLADAAVLQARTAAHLALAKAEVSRLRAELVQATAPLTEFKAAQAVTAEQRVLDAAREWRAVGLMDASTADANLAAAVDALPAIPAPGGTDA